MFCPECGFELPDGATFCPECGTHIDASGIAHASKEKEQSVLASSSEPSEQSAPKLASGPETAQESASHPTADAGASKSATDASVSQPTADAGASQPSQAPSKRSKPPIVLIVAAACAVLGIIFFIVGSNQPANPGPASVSSSQTTDSDPTSTGPTSAEDAIADAADAIDKLFLKDIHIDDDVYERIARDQQVLDEARASATGDDVERYRRASAAMTNVMRSADLIRDLMDAIDPAANFDEKSAGVENTYELVSTIYDNLVAIEAPKGLEAPLKKLADNSFGLYRQALNAEYIKQNASDRGVSVLYAYQSAELADWAVNASGKLANPIMNAVAAQNNESRLVLRGEAPDQTEASFEAVKNISPNLYPSMAAVANVQVTSRQEQQDILVEAEIVGFSQKLTNRVSVDQGITIIPVKPQVLPSLTMADLAKDKTTQLNITVSEADTGRVLIQRSEGIVIRSINAFNWEDDEFGVTAPFNILAWMQPDDAEIDAIVREASDWLTKWTNGEVSMVGYQTDYVLTEIAALQKAISERGVVYTMDDYSFTADQNVLMPTQTLSQRHGLCIETSLLMASCLKRMAMHPMLVITPGHAQVAVETNRGSGNYWLVETTSLPYNVNEDQDWTTYAFYGPLLDTYLTPSGEASYWTFNGTADEWKAYLESVSVSDGNVYQGGVFVIDCDLLDIMGLQGLNV